MTLTGVANTNPIVGGGLPVPPRALEKYISFDLAGATYCVEASAVAEVVPPLAVTQLPDGPEWLLGLAAQRGDVVAVIDPRTIKADSAFAAEDAKSKLIVFRPLADGSQFALPVDALRQLFSAAPADFSASVGSSPFQPKETVREFGPVKLLDHTTLFESFYEHEAVS